MGFVQVGRRPIRAGGAALLALAMAVGGLAAGGTSAGGTTRARTAPARHAAKRRATIYVPPRLPRVPLADTDGYNELSLYERTIRLADASQADAPLQAEIDKVQQALDADAVIANHAERVEFKAEAAASTADGVAKAARAHYDALATALRASAINLYMSGPPDLGQSSLQSATQSVWDAGLLDLTVSANGILAERHDVLLQATTEAAKARSELSTAAAAAGRADVAVASERKAGAALEADLARINRADAVSLTAAHSTLAREAGIELTGSHALQFKAKHLAAPLKTASTALSWAFAELGVPYLWGGTGVGGFDCSGLTQYVWGKAGVQIPRIAGAQYYWTDPVPLSQLAPGDLVFFVGSDGSESYPGHVGIYIGDGLMIDAPYTGTVVQVNSIWFSDLIGFGRVHADGAPIASHQVPRRIDFVVAAAGTVPSETKPPPGYKKPKRKHPAPTTTTTVAGGGGSGGAPPEPSTTTTTVPPSTTTTTIPPTTTTTGLLSGL